MTTTAVGMPTRRAPALTFALPDETEPELDLIWNLTLVCIWDCSMCCVDAVHVFVRDGYLVIRSEGLSIEQRVPRDHSMTAYDQALKIRQDLGLELTYEGKLRVLDNLYGFDVQIDVSGGDPLAVTENVSLVEETSRRFGRNRVTLTATGAGLKHRDATAIGSLIKELNFTYDGEADPDDPNRPSAYARGNLAVAKRYSRQGVRTRAECPLTQHNIDPRSLDRIYRSLHDAGIDRLLVMRLFPSGRGGDRGALEPTEQQYRAAVDYLRGLEATYGSPKVKLQCALRGIDGPAAENPCDAVVKSFGLTANGVLLGSPWAIGPRGEPEEPWVIGNLHDVPMKELLNSPKVKRFRALANVNNPMCKYIASKHGKSENAVDRIFEHTDPLYARSLPQAG